MTAKTEKAVNYTEAQTVEMVGAYKAAPTSETVEALAAKLGKSTRSVIAKLTREGVYQKKEYKTKAGEAPQPKAELATAIGKVLRMSEPDTESLTKATKKALQTIWEALATSKPIEG